MTEQATQMIENGERDGGDLLLCLHCVADGFTVVDRTLIAPKWVAERNTQ